MSEPSSVLPDLISTLSLHHPEIALPRSTTPASGNKTVTEQTLQLDFTIHTAVSNLIHRFIQPLSPFYTHAVLLKLRDHLTKSLLEAWSPSWDETRPSRSCGFRSLICDREHGLPVPLKAAAKSAGVDEEVWIKALAKRRKKEGAPEVLEPRWEAWCDPGSVSWRYGGWEWETEFDPFAKVPNESVKVLWQATSTLFDQPTGVSSNDNGAPATNTTPVRSSRAIPIRAPAPALFQIPPTPAHEDQNGSMQLPLRVPSPTLLPPVVIGGQNRRSSPMPTDNANDGPQHDHEHSSEEEDSDDSIHENENENHARARTRTDPLANRNSSHRGSGSGSSSSISTSISDTNSGVSQLLTPGTRPGSADIFSVPADPRAHALGLGHGLGTQGKTPVDSVNRGRTPSPGTPLPRGSTTPSSNTTVTPLGGTGTGTGTGAGMSSTTPTVTPYDGGNVIVMGGGVPLGGSRASSVISHSRTPIDRTRSPSISIASRALGSATGRKPRRARRVNPSYLGPLDQPGVGGPVNGVFSGFMNTQGAYVGQSGQMQAVWDGQGYLPVPPHLMARMAMAGAAAGHVSPQLQSPQM